MRSATISFALLLLALTSARAAEPAADWPCWRGPNGNGAAADQPLPLAWSSTEHVVWKAKVPGRGHGSPIVAGENVFLQTAEVERDIQSVLCYDRLTGAQKWRTDVHTSGLEHKKGHKKSTQASSTPACDGERLIVNFLNQEAIYTTALDLKGQRLWQTKVSDFAIHQGFGSSPTLFGPLAIIATDSKSGGAVAALVRTTGKIAWQSPRPELPNYASATLVRAAGRDQLVIQGCDLVASFEPLTGRKLWETAGATTECVTSLVTDGERVFVSGGYPRNHVQAIAADGSGKTAWENTAKVYVPSMIVHQGHLFATQDGGIAICWDSRTGQEKWKERLGGDFTASLVLVGDNLLATSDTGETSIFKADPAKFQLVGKNKLGDEAYATPAICGGRIYTRVVEKSGDQRQEMLYCLGSP